MSHSSIIGDTQTARTLRRLAREASKRVFRQHRRDRIAAKHHFLCMA